MPFYGSTKYHWMKNASYIYIGTVQCRLVCIKCRAESNNNHDKKKHQFTGAIGWVYNEGRIKKKETPCSPQKVLRAE